MQKFLATFLILWAIGSVGLSGTAHAEDCGSPPGPAPLAPNGETASRIQIDAAIAALRTYAQITNRYLDCLDRNQQAMFFNMTAEQQERWVEDYNDLLQGLADAQDVLNAQIRAFNARDNNSSS